MPDPEVAERIGDGGRVGVRRVEEAEMDADAVAVDERVGLDRGERRDSAALAVGRLAGHGASRAPASISRLRQDERQARMLEVSGSFVRFRTSNGACLATWKSAPTGI